MAGLGTGVAGRATGWMGGPGTGAAGQGTGRDRGLASDAAGPATGWGVPANAVAALATGTGVLANAPAERERGTAGRASDAAGLGNGTGRVGSGVGLQSKMGRGAQKIPPPSARRHGKYPSSPTCIPDGCGNAAVGNPGRRDAPGEGCSLGWMLPGMDTPRDGCSPGRMLPGMDTPRDGYSLGWMPSRMDDPRDGHMQELSTSRRMRAASVVSPFFASQPHPAMGFSPGPPRLPPLRLFSCSRARRIWLCRELRFLRRHSSSVSSV